MKVASRSSKAAVAALAAVLLGVVTAGAAGTRRGCTARRPLARDRSAVLWRGQDRFSGDVLYRACALPRGRVRLLGRDQGLFGGEYEGDLRVLGAALAGSYAAVWQQTSNIREVEMCGKYQQQSCPQLQTSSSLHVVELRSGRRIELSVTYQGTGRPAFALCRAGAMAWLDQTGALVATRLRPTGHRLDAVQVVIAPSAQAPSAPSCVGSALSWRDANGLERRRL